MNTVDRIELRQGDRLPGFQAVIEDEHTGEPVDLTNATGVFLVLLHQDSGEFLEAECLIVSAVGGYVYYDWQTTNDATPGVYDLSARVEFNDDTSAVATGVELVILPAVTIPTEVLLVNSEGVLLVNSEGLLLSIIE